MFGSDVDSIDIAKCAFGKASAKFILLCAGKCVCCACFLFLLIFCTLVKFLCVYSCHCFMGFLRDKPLCQPNERPLQRFLVCHL